MVDESRESTDKLNQKKQDVVTIFRGVAMVLGEDFENQRQFKCVAYLDFVVDEFKSIARMESNNESRTFKEEMNFRLKMISTAL